MAKVLISIVVPVYCEEANIAPLYEEVRELFRRDLSLYDFELIFINDGSRDQTAKRVLELCERDPHCRLIDLARNFGKEIALSTAMPYVSGEAAICIDADLQHPPSYIPLMLKAWEEGADIVEMVRVSQVNEPMLRRLSSDIFYWFLNKISEVQISPKTTDFRLLDRKVVQSISQIQERQRMFRGLVDWVGFRKVAFPFEAAERIRGESVYSYAKLTNLALNSFISYSSLPLKFVGIAGLLITTLSVLFIGVLLGNYVIFGNSWNVRPLAIVTVFNTILIGLVLTALGLMSLYISKIYSETQNRPLSVIRNTINFSDAGLPPERVRALNSVIEPL